MAFNSVQEILLDLILQALQGTPVTIPTDLQYNTVSEQLLYNILQAISTSPIFTGAILKDGSVPYNNDASQVWQGSGNHVYIGPATVQIGTTNNTLTINPSDASIRQDTPATGSNTHVIGGVKVAASVLDATKYLETKINGATVKVAIIA